MSLRWIVTIALVACGEHGPSEPARRPPIELDVERELAARFGGAVTARCAVVAGVPMACLAVIDGLALPVAVEAAGSAWTWRIDGRVVATAPVVAYIDGVLGDLGVAQTARCGPAAVRLPPGQRLPCKLSGGGVAFVDVAREGRVSLELALDPAVAAIRAEPVPDRELVRASRALERTGDEDDEPDELPPVDDKTAAGDARVPPRE